MDKKKTVIRVIIEVVIIYMIFVWNNGEVFAAVKKVLDQMLDVFYPYLERLIVVLKTVSPYGRSAVQSDPYYKELMDRCSLATAISLAAYLYASLGKSKDNMVKKIFWSVVCSFVTWYALYLDCRLLARIPQDQTSFTYLSIAFAALILWLVIYFLFFKKRIS